MCFWQKQRKVLFDSARLDATTTTILLIQNGGLSHPPFVFVRTFVLIYSCILREYMLFRYFPPGVERDSPAGVFKTWPPFFFCNLFPLFTYSLPLMLNLFCFPNSFFLASTPYSLCFSRHGMAFRSEGWSRIPYYQSLFRLDCAVCSSSSACIMVRMQVGRSVHLVHIGIQNCSTSY